MIRRTAAERRRRERVQGLALARLFAGRAPPPRPDPEAETQRSQIGARLVSALSLLPARQREVLHLVFYGEQSIQQAAVAMGVSLGAARTHYQRGKRRLRGLLEEQRS